MNIRFFQLLLPLPFTKETAAKIFHYLNFFQLKKPELLVSVAVAQSKTTLLSNERAAK